MTHYATLLLGGLLALAGTIRAQTPTFAPIVNYSTGSSSYPGAVAVADINGDSKPDVVVATNLLNGTTNIGVFRGTGNGTFGPMTAYTAGSSTAVAAVDVSGDGRPDVITGSAYGSAVGVLLNSSSGLTSVRGYSAGNNSSPSGLAIIDVNNDGKLDIVTANYRSNTVGVLLGMGAGLFNNAVEYAAGTFSLPAGVAVADVNGDNWPDIAVANSGSGTAGVLLGTGAGQFGAVTAYSLGTGSNLYGVALADVNNDGKLDLLAANQGKSTVGVLLGTGTGTFGAASAYSTGYDARPRSIVVADVNGDGQRDAVVANYYNGTVGVLPGLGNGTFGTVVSFRTGTSGGPQSATAADVNGDGRPDLISANYDTHTVGVLLNTTPLPIRAALPGATASLAPNPAGAATTLSVEGLPAAATQVQATMLDATGRVVGRHALAARQGSARAELPVAGLAPGLYVVRLAACDAQGTVAGMLPAQALSVH